VSSETPGEQRTSLAAGCCTRRSSVPYATKKYYKENFGFIPKNIIRRTLVSYSYFRVYALKKHAPSIYKGFNKNSTQKQHMGVQESGVYHTARF
jgi:hypothetical protein